MANWWEAPAPAASAVALFAAGGAAGGGAGAADGLDEAYSRIASSSNLQSSATAAWAAQPAPNPLAGYAAVPWARPEDSERAAVRARMLELEQQLRREQQRSAELESRLRASDPVRHEWPGGSIAASAAQRLAELERRRLQAEAQQQLPPHRQSPDARPAAVCRGLPSLSPESPGTPRVAVPAGSPPPMPGWSAAWQAVGDDGRSPSPPSPLSPMMPADMPAPALAAYRPEDEVLYRAPVGRPPPHRRPSPKRSAPASRQLPTPSPVSRRPPQPAPSPHVPSSTPSPVGRARRPSHGPAAPAARAQPSQPSAYLGDRRALDRALRKHGASVATSTNFVDIHHLVRRGDSVNASTSVWADGLRESIHAADGARRARPAQREQGWCGRLKRDVGWTDIGRFDRRRREEQHSQCAGGGASRSSSAPPPPRSAPHGRRGLEPRSRFV